MNKKRVISNFLNIKNNTFEIVIIAIFVALGINLLTSGLTSITNEPSINFIYIEIGAALIVISLFIRTKSMLNILKKDIKLDCFFIYDNDNKMIYPVKEYKISEDMNRYLKAAFFENNALKVMWEREEFKRDDNNEKKQTSLLVEIIEYCILKKLSYFLSSYFNDLDIKENELIHFNRIDLPDILLKNKFLNLFSEDIENRAAFVNVTDSSSIIMSNNGEEKIVAMVLPNGIKFESFDLVLPDKSEVKRVDKNSILIDMNEFSIKISIDFDNYNTYIDGDFYECYLGILDYFEKYDTYIFDVRIEVDFKFKALFKLKKKKYYAWIDDFIDELDKYCDKNTFLNNINWNHTKTILTCLKNIKIKE